MASFSHSEAPRSEAVTLALLTALVLPSAACRSSAPNSSSQASSAPPALAPTAAAAPVASTALAAPVGSGIAAASPSSSSFVDAPPVALTTKVIKEQKPSCRTNAKVFQVVSGIDQTSLARVNALLSPPESWFKCAPGIDVELESKLHLNAHGILSVEVRGGKLNRARGDSRYASGDEAWLAFVNVTVPSGAEIAEGGLFSNDGGQGLEKLVQPELEKALQQPGFSPKAELQRDVEICLQFFTPPNATYLIQERHLIVSGASTLPPAFAALPALSLPLDATVASGVIRTDGPLGPLLRTLKPSR